MTANPWHSADRVKHKSWPVIFSNLFLLSPLFMEEEVPFFFHPGARGIFHQCQNSLSVPHAIGFTFQGLPIRGYPFSSNYIFLWVISACTLWLSLYAAQYLYSSHSKLQYLSVYPQMCFNKSILSGQQHCCCCCFFRMRSMKPRVKSINSRTPEGVRSFSERRNWLQLAKRFFQVFFCPL